MEKTIILLMIIVPVIFGAVLPFLKMSRRGMKLGIITAILALEAVGAVVLFNVTVNPFTLVQMTRTLTLGFFADEVAKLFLLIITFGWLAVGIYSFVYIKHEGNEDRFFAFYLIVEGVFVGMATASNLISMYLCYELITLTSMPLVLHSGTKESIAAALKYLYYSIAGAFMALFCIVTLSIYTTTLEFIPGGSLDVSLLSGHETLVLAAIFAGALGFGAKAGMYPLHGWLPTAHPVAPAPASAVLSGIIAKAGVLAIIRVIYYNVGAAFLRGTWVQYALISLALLTVFMGSMMAYRENVFKKRLAYSTVSQISYVLAGLFLLTPEGVVGGVLHIIFHASIKITLFLVAGSVIFNTGKTKVDELRGIGKQMPVTIWSYTFASLALIGIPPFSGFVSKWYLASAALDSGLGVFTWLVPVILLISALLTAGYLLPVTIMGFFPGKDYKFDGARCEKDKAMLIPIVVLAVFTLLSGLLPGGITAWVTELAALIA